MCQMELVAHPTSGSKPNHKYQPVTARTKHFAVQIQSLSTGIAIIAVGLAQPLSQGGKWHRDHSEVKAGAAESHNSAAYT